MTFCKSLSNAISFRIPGDSNTLTFNPCCLYDDYIPFHPTLFVKERKKFLEADTFLPGCSKCKLTEKTQNSSLRKMSNNELPNDIGDDVVKLEIVLDTTCNAACIQCGPSQSSLWRKEVDTVKKIYHIQPEQQIDDKIALIKKSINFDKVKFFHFWGGEPLLTDTHLKFLNEIENPKDVSLTYTTNSSIVPSEKILRLWEKFKLVKISVSLDGIEDKFHYIRWPLNWEKAKHNLFELRDNTPLNILYFVNCCVIPLNAYYVNELEIFLKENFHTTRAGERITYKFIRGEGMLDIANTPLSLREEIWKRLPDNHDIANLLREVPVIDSDKMIKYLDYWDAHRKLEWRKIFPDIVKHFE